MSRYRRIDIHAHLNLPEFAADGDAALKRALDDGTAVVNVGTDLASSRSALALAEAAPEGVSAIVGLHPNETGETFDPAPYRALLASPRAIGIGECGLDYFRQPADSAARQKAVFESQIALSLETGKPLMLHIRQAYEDALEILAAHPGVRGDVHFFAGTTDIARRFLDLGFTLSFTGVITFAPEYAELVKFAPLDMIQAETDCPYVAPVPYRGKRNEPAYVREVTAAIARIKGLPLDAVEAQLLENAQRVFGIEL